MIGQFLVIGTAGRLRIPPAAEREAVAGFTIAKHLAQARPRFVLFEVALAPLFGDRAPAVTAFTFDGRKDIGNPADRSDIGVRFGRGQNLIDRVNVGLIQFAKAIAETVEESLAVELHSPSCSVLRRLRGSLISTKLYFNEAIFQRS